MKAVYDVQGLITGPAEDLKWVSEGAICFYLSTQEVAILPLAPCTFSI